MSLSSPQTRVHHLALRTRDVPRLERFYREALGLPPWPVQAGNGVWLDLGGAILMIEQAEPGEAGPSAGSLDLLAIRNDAQDSAQTEARLAQLDVGIEARTTHTLYFRDPDGRRVALSTYPLAS